MGAIGPHLNRFAAHLTPGTASRVGVLYESLKRSDEYSGALSVVYIIVFVSIVASVGSDKPTTEGTARSPRQI